MAHQIKLKCITMFLGANRRLSNQKRQSSKSKAKGKQRKIMDETSGKLNPKMMESLKKRTKFTKDELEALCRIYKKLISNPQYSTRVSSLESSSVIKPHAQAEGIDRIVFRELLHSTFDIVTEEILMERMFCVWDLNKDKEGLPLRLEGWLIGLSTFLRGSFAEKTAFCFRVYDLNGDGFITKDEMFTLLRNCLIKQPQDEDPDESVKDLVEIILKKFDIDKDNKISYEDYSETVATQPLLLEAFGQILPSHLSILAFFTTLHG